MLTKYTISREKFYLEKVMFHVCRMMQVLHRWQHHMTLTEYYHIYPRLKPIFHCDAKYLASAVGVDARILRWRYQHVGIFWRYLTLTFALAPTQNLKFALAPTPTPDATTNTHIG